MSDWKEKRVEVTKLDWKQRIVVRKLLRRKNIEDALSYMRKAGLGKADTISMLLASGFDVEIVSELVFESATWADVRERDMAVRKQVAEEVNRLADLHDGVED